MVPLTPHDCHMGEYVERLQGTSSIISKVDSNLLQDEDTLSTTDSSVHEIRAKAQTTNTVFDTSHRKRFTVTDVMLVILLQVLHVVRLTLSKLFVREQFLQTIPSLLHFR